MGVVYSHSRRFTSGYDTAVISGRSRLCKKHLGLDAFWHGVTVIQCIDRVSLVVFFRLFFASGLGRRNWLRLAALLFFPVCFRLLLSRIFIFSKGDTSLH